ncbi:MAG: 50S ribosomal protein L17 [Clostridia bacterium]|nr:50S ribosomal protein L17 [Clostridia bacterium]
MENRKLGKATDIRMALLRGQVTDLLWYGKIETTFDRAKEVQKIAEKLLTKAINSYTDTVKKVESRQRKKKDKKGNVTVEEYKVELVNDGPKKLAARRAIMAVVYDAKESKAFTESKAAYRARTGKIQHPLIEKIFNEYAPKYANRAEEKGTKGGYTRVLRNGFRRGDGAELALIELV